MMISFALMVLNLASLSEGRVKVTFDCPAESLSRLVPRLAVAINLPLRVSAQIDDEVCCVSVHEANPAEVLQRLALATGGAWQHDGASLVLVPDWRNRDEKTELAMQSRSARFARSLKSAGQLDLASGPGASQAETGSAEQRFAVTILDLIGANTLAKIRPGERLVFSNAPTPSQLLLPEEANIFGARYLTEVRNSSPFSSVGAVLHENDGCADDENANQANKFDFIVSRDSSANMFDVGGIHVGFKWYDASSKTVSQLSYDEVIDIDHESEYSAPYIDTCKDRLLTFNSLRKEFSDKWKLSEKANIRLPQRWTEFLTFLNTSDADRASISPTLRQTLLHPDLVDPLDIPAEWLREAAKYWGIQLVAAIPDDAFRWVLGGLSDSQGMLKDSSKVNIADVFTNLEAATDVSVAFDHSWLVITRTDYRTVPINRQRLADLSAHYWQRKSLPLPELQIAADAGMGTREPDAVLEQWMWCICPELTEIQGDWAVARLLSKMVLVNRDREAATEASIGSLDADARSELQEVVFFPQGLSDLEKDANEVIKGSVIETYPKCVSYVPPDVQNEPTEMFLPNLSNENTLVITINRDTVLRSKVRALEWPHHEFLQGVTPEELGAFSVIVKRDPTLNSAIEVDIGDVESYFKSFEVGIRDRIQCKVYDSWGSYRVINLNVYEFDSHKIYSMGSMPRELLDRYTSAVDVARKSAFELLSKVSGNSTP